MNDGAGATTDTEVPPTNEGNGAPPERHTGWRAFHQRYVLVQLKEPYVVPTYPSYMPEMVEGGGMKATQSIPGMLFVEPDHQDGFMLILRVNGEREGDFALIAIDPGNVMFCTHIVEGSPIVRP